MPSDAVAPLKPYQVWLVLAVAAVGFLFDTYELLMFPVIGAPAIVGAARGPPPNNPEVRSGSARCSGSRPYAAGCSGCSAGA